VIRHFLNPPNWLTAASIFCSVYAMALVIAGDPTPQTLSRASILVIFGGVFDLLDGRVARMTNRFTEFGTHLDSIADAFGFGLAPALITWAWALHELGPVGIAITFSYVLCAAFRLARFNVDQATHAWPLDGHSQGLTSTMAGGSLVTFVWVSNGYLSEVIHVPPIAVAGLVVGLGLLMVSSIPFRNFKDLRDNKRARRILAVFLAACLAGAIVLDPSMLWGVGAVLYLSFGLIDGLITAMWHHRVSQVDSGK
jgi:CDP-diacylglycerol--serine O-phosphatidyltransferase